MWRYTDAAAQVRVFELAAEWRQTWGGDVVIDLIGYRRYGGVHNEKKILVSTPNAK